MEDDISETVLELIAEELKVPRAQIPTDVPLHDLGIDSLRLLELSMNVEERLNITIADEALPTFSGVADLIAFVRARRVLASGQAAPGGP
jgi:acyl carrier protein